MNSHFGQTELVLPLFEGLFEAPLWETFLQRLMARTQAQRVRLTIAPSIVSDHPSVHRRVVARGSEAASGLADEDAALTLLAATGFRSNRVYVLDELRDTVETAGSKDAGERLKEARIGDARLLRISTSQKDSVWITLLHEREAFQAADSALLAALVPAIRIAAQNLFMTGALKARMDVAEASLARLGIGQAILDGQGGLIACDPSWESEKSTAQDRDLQLSAACAELRSWSEKAVAVVPAPKSGRPFVVRRLAGCALPFSSSAAAVASYRTPQSLDAASIEPVIAATFGLTPREAALAARLATGDSLTKAGKSLGLSVETARNYSKRIFAKTGTHGQTDLVRGILSRLP
ncbi:helix-turn-helix transcriptional regulator [Aquisediminimonas profunda]|uniref:helix-turn-helix transcriptional regulator n=1 Tax=Aquisediminimonas profunda TaxID=1550733 RepID=UPI001C62AFB0|nr:LuxR C-terminal-related transcriptional regulator [Aquisediminimonas profunda]